MKRHLTTMTLLALLLAAAGTLKAQQAVDGWKKINTGVQGALYGIRCLDADHLVACGQDGVILKSNDGGETWQQKHQEEGCDLNALEFSENGVGYAFGYQHPNDGVLLKTLDAGETWARVAETGLAYANDNSPYAELLLVDADTLYVYLNEMLGRHPALFKSTDGGHSFVFVNLPFESAAERSGSLAVAARFEDNEGYCLYSALSAADDQYYELRAFRTTDFGQTWSRHTVLSETDGETGNLWLGFVKTHALGKSEARLFFLQGYFDTDDGFASPAGIVNLAYGEEGTCFRGDSDYPAGMRFTGDMTGCFVSNEFGMSTSSLVGRVGITNDGGDTWQLRMEGVGIHPLFAVDGVDTVFYLTSDQGNVYKRCLIDDTALPEDALEGLKVAATWMEGCVVLSGALLSEATVHNALGQHVFTQRSATDKMALDLSAQPAGLYFITVTGQNGERCVKKVVKQ